MVIASTINISCTLAASFCSRDEFMSFFVLFVGGQAICNGLSYLVPLQMAWKAFPENSGLAAGIVVGGFGLGGLIFAFLSTKLVNPWNLSMTTDLNG